MSVTVQGTGNGQAIAGSSQENESQKGNPYLITEEMLQNRLEQKNRGRFITQLACGLAASLAALSFGTALGWTSAVPSYIDVNSISMQKFNLSEEHYGWITSLMPLGCSMGIVPWSYGINSLGPKHIMILQTPLYVLTFLIMTTVKTFESYLAGRFFSGFILISYVIGGERLLSDSVHMGYLPIMTVFFRTSTMIGIFLSYIIGGTLSSLYLEIICLSIPLVNSILLLILPESPVFLYKRSERKAKVALRWYRGKANIYMAMQSLRKDAEIRKMGSEMYMLYSKVVMRALLIIIGLNFFRVFSGYYVFIFYTVLFWREYEDVFTSFGYIITFGLFLCISNFIGNLFHYHSTYGIRKPLLISCSLISISLTILTIFTLLGQWKGAINLKHLTWIPSMTINIFLISYAMGLGTYPDIILYDYLPYQVHVTAKIISDVLNWFEIFLLIKYFLTVKSLTFDAINFGIMAIISYLSIFYCYHFIIETKGKNLLQIQIEIGGNPVGNRGAYRYRVEHGLSIS